ncbi:unnamed protein product [Brassica oleracea var. botrytis]|uniref:(rape) hypothetical protein n=1 Tax=Brassica napus TaxID=3708 RepID=A0A816MD94_BRANA|nr:unnamed protein product [Brassica napus]
MKVRLQHGVAEVSAEIPKGTIFLFLFPLLSCYVGQELIARTHHRGVKRKRLIQLRFIDSNGKEVNQEIAAGAEVVESGSGKKIGTVSGS